MKSKNVVKLLGYGNEGTIETPEGKVKVGYVYSITDFVQGFPLNELNHLITTLGEIKGQFIFDQILNVLEKLEEKYICHSNITID